MPARRPFFENADPVPRLVQDASNRATRQEVFKYSFAGGWPSPNSYVRILAGFLAVLASFSFAFIATLVSERGTRLTFTGVLVTTAITALAAIVLDAMSLAKTAAECSAKKCVTALPEEVTKAKGLSCLCAPDGWFWVTLGVDVVLFVSAVTCIVLTVKPLLFNKR